MPSRARTHADLAGKVRSLLKCRERGKALYAQADTLLEELLAALRPGQQIDLGGGRRAEVVDQFDSKNTVWKPAGVRRFELKITEEA